MAISGSSCLCVELGRSPRSTYSHESVCCFETRENGERGSNYALCAQEELGATLEKTGEFIQAIDHRCACGVDDYGVGFILTKKT